MLSFGFFQSSEELNGFLFSKSNKLVGFFHEGMASFELTGNSSRFALVFVFVVELFDFIFIFFNDHLCVMLRSIA
jgi:hypothetical protein